MNPSLISKEIPHLFFSGENLHIFSLTQPVFPNLLATLYLAFNAPSFIVKKKNGYTILNPANEIFGFGHYPCLPTVYN